MNTPNLEWTRELLIWCSHSIPFKSSNGTRLSQAKDPTWSLSDFKQSAVTQPTLLDRSHPGISYQLTPLLSGRRHAVPGRTLAKSQVLLCHFPNLRTERHRGTNWPLKCHWSNTSAPCWVQTRESRTVVPRTGKTGIAGQTAGCSRTHCVLLRESQESRK